jgi:hypothetical protein
MTVFEHTTKCPHCGTVNPLATGLSGGGGPNVSDVTLCIACGSFSVFDKKLALRKPTGEEQVWFATNRDTRRLYFAWLMTQRKVTAIRRAKQ